MEKSKALFEKAQKLFPGGVNSPVRAFRSVGGTPLFIEKGEGPFVFDADGKKYIDFCGSWGPLIHGHAHPDIVKAITTTAAHGTSFGAPTRLENELASLIIENHKGIEKMRFVSSGTEAVMSAIRLARGYTGKNKIIKFEGCYHGHSDALLVKAGSGLVTLGNSSSAGVPKSFVNETIVLPLNSEKALEEAYKKFPDDIACVIIEPIPANNGLLLQRQEYLKFLRDITTKHKSLLIFDEVISGFRIGFEGASGYYNITPDLFTFGKILGGGMPVGAYAASAEIMGHVSPEGKVYQAGTLSGNPLAMAAGLAQLQLCLKGNFYPDLEAKTRLFAEIVSEGIGPEKGFYLIQIGSIFWFNFSGIPQIRAAHDIDAGGMTIFNMVFHDLLKAGIYFGPSGYEVGFISSVHTPEIIEKAGKSINAILKKHLN